MVGLLRVPFPTAEIHHSEMSLFIFLRTVHWSISKFYKMNITHGLSLRDFIAEKLGIWKSRGFSRKWSHKRAMVLLRRTALFSSSSSIIKAQPQKRRAHVKVNKNINNYGHLLARRYRRQQGPPRPSAEEKKTIIRKCMMKELE